MEPARDNFIRSTANELLRQVWVDRVALGIRSDDADDVLRVAPRVAAERILLLEVIEFPEIAPTPAERLAGIEVAGILYRLERKIFLSKQFKTISRRFTLAHEIGHYMLHPHATMHRDRPIEGRSLERRPTEEREADLFAAEFLIPSRRLREVFNQSFGQPVDLATGSNGMIYKLAVGTGAKPDFVKRAVLDPFRAAMLFAVTTSYGLRVFDSLSSQFAVSPTAMAIQLLDLDLVFVRETVS